MDIFYRVDENRQTIIEGPCALPPEYAYATPDTQLDAGWWPAMRIVEGFDPYEHRLTDDFDPVVDSDHCRVIQRLRYVPLTALEKAELLETRRAATVIKINAEAGAQRARHITVTTGQEGTYIEKAAEARAFASDPAPDPARYPYLEAEAGYTGQTLDDLATVVLATAAAWTTINAQIEGLRQRALRAAASASSPGDLDALFPISWP